MLTKYISPGDRIELHPAQNEEDDEPKKAQKVYRSKIYDIVSEDEIKVVMPMEKGKLVLLPVDVEYTLCIYSGSGLYQCNAKVTERYRSNNVYMLTMELTSSLRRFQRREYYRLNCVLEMKCTSVTDEQRDKLYHNVEFVETDFVLQDGVIVDISGGGARFISPEKYEKGATILFMFSLTIGDKTTPYSVLGNIITSNELEGKTGQFENRVQFIDIDNDDREGIIRYVFEEERKIRRREKS